VVRERGEPRTRGEGERSGAEGKGREGKRREGRVGEAEMEKAMGGCQE
jgi:hypothetical protein